jgi:GT2 family glycosyltransferase
VADNHPVDASVIIPTRGRPDLLSACLRALAAAPGAARAEVLVSIDGHDPDAADAARRAWRSAGGDPADLRVIQGDHAGQATARNRALPLARGEFIIALNDDTIPQPGLIDAHLAAQRRAQAAARPAIVVGRTPWLVHHPDSAFARLLRETSMVFFQDVMDQDPDPARDWGFRHAWLINLSLPASLARDLSGWAVFPCTYGYEDDDFAFRAAHRFATPVLYQPAAVALHDHPMTPREYLEREYRLGYAAVGFAQAAPACAAAMFGRDVRDPAEAAYSREFVRRERRDALRAWHALSAWGDAPADALGPARDSALVRAAYGQHLVLKRWTWRVGLLAAHESRPMRPDEALPGLEADTPGAPPAPPARTARAATISPRG